MLSGSTDSDSWKGVSECHDPVLRESAERCNRTTRWDNVVAMCSDLRGGIACCVGENFTMGSQNFVRPIKFDDGVKWVIRIPLDARDVRWAATMAERMASEVATYKYLRRYTSIPVPEVHRYSLDDQHDLGVPYMLLTYLEGTLAYNVQLSDEQTYYVQQQIISIMLELADQRFERIGNLVMDDNDFFCIGKEMETNQGPFTTAEQYYHALGSHRFHTFADRYLTDNLAAEKRRGIELPCMFDKLMPIFTDCARDCGPFGLTNTDLGFHNIILDATCKIIGMIDCDNIIAAPVYTVAQIPALMGVRRTPPGLIVGNGKFGSLWRKSVARFERFYEQFKIAEAHYGKGTPIADAMTSDAARLVEGLEVYGLMSTDLIELWARSYLYIYYRRLIGASRAVEFSDPDISANVEDEGADSKSDDNDTVLDEQENDVTSSESEAEDAIVEDQPDDSTSSIAGLLTNSSAQSTVQTVAEGKENGQQGNSTDINHESIIDIQQQSLDAVEDGAKRTEPLIVPHHNDQETHLTCAAPDELNNAHIHENCTAVQSTDKSPDLEVSDKSVDQEEHLKPKFNKAYIMAEEQAKPWGNAFRPEGEAITVEARLKASTPSQTVNSNTQEVAAELQRIISVLQNLLGKVRETMPRLEKMDTASHGSSTVS